MNTRNAVSLGTVYIYIDNTTRKKCSLFNHGEKYIFVQQSDTHTLCLQDYRIGGQSVERESRSLTATAVLACKKAKISLQTRKLHIIYRAKINDMKLMHRQTVY